MICRTGTHILHFAAYRKELGGWGRGAKRAIGAWFTAQTPEQLAYQAIKYPSRDGWALADVLRLTHPRTNDEALNAVFRYIVDGITNARTPEQIIAREQLKLTETQGQNQPDATASGLPTNGPTQLIARHRLPREAIPNELLNNPETWDALLSEMPMTAMIRNLGKMSRIGLLVDGSDTSRIVTERLRDPERLKRSRVHPIALLSALKVYERGHGVRGDLQWQPAKSVVTALDEAFYLAFGFIEPSGKRLRCSLDVSRSMTWPAPGLVGLNCRDVAAAMALVTVVTEPQAEILAFSHELVPLDIRPTMRLDEVVRLIDTLPFGGTYCALPIAHALQQQEVVDAFVTYTDAETTDGAGPGFPSRSVHEWLQLYRKVNGIATRNVVVAFAANNVTLADPRDPLALDIAGFDATGPSVISDFIRGVI